MDLAKQLGSLTKYSFFLKRIEPSTITPESLIQALNIAGIQIPDSIAPAATRLIQASKSKNMFAALSDPAMIADLQTVLDGHAPDAVERAKDITPRTVECHLTCPYCSNPFIRNVTL